ncbi:hypothetical protein CTAYLR_008637 [Chrysophaeum taylorii]|uniref:Uncharacterized protein n=1 Tax=Chrysophaeum taylorii TaxID=2483200 RepID=A0AAD7UHN4_9STRA|nr:hypothetical protein CTAYLR_008637 [Chrysophaeum taylorii]
MNPSSHASRPISTAMSRQLIGTRGQLTSSMGTQAAQGVALGTTVNVSERPVTQQGMRGMKTAAGPSRQVQDSSYYVGVLHNKVNELEAEITELDNEVRQHNRAMNEFGGLRRRHETLLAEVRGLEGTLADYNLAMDKARASTDPAELDAYVVEFEGKNRRLAEEVDRVFVLKKQKDDETKQLERQIEALREQAQRKINALGPTELERYDGLLARSHELTRQRDEVLAKLEAAKAKEASDGGRQLSHAEAYDALSRKLARLEKDETNATEELAIWEIEDPKEALARLKQRIETQSKEVKSLDGVAKDLEEQIATTKKQIAELDAENEADGGRAKTEGEKYEKLRKRDEEMTEFIHSFDETKASTLEDQRQTQDTIVALLEHVSQGLEHENNMPSQQQLREMRDEATFKERQLESSQQTTLRLLQEKKQREAELAKIDNLDEKIQIELASLEKKMGVMRADMIEFDDLDGLRRRAAATMSALSRLLKEYQGRKETIRLQASQVSAKYEDLKAKINASEAHKTLTDLEAKLKTYAQTIFQLQEYVDTKSRQTDYKQLKENCNHLVDNLNAIAKKRNME